MDFTNNTNNRLLGSMHGLPPHNILPSDSPLLYNNVTLRNSYYTVTAKSIYCNFNAINLDMPSYCNVINSTIKPPTLFPQIELYLSFFFSQEYMRQNQCIFFLINDRST